MNLFASILEEKKYPTNKSIFNYQYEDAFLSVRNEIKSVWEVGVRRGGGLRVFQDYFPNANIVGLEIRQGGPFKEGRMEIERGDATKSDFLNTVLKKHGDPDIVVDDASHMCDDMVATFKYLYPHTKYCYVVEDLQTQETRFKGGNGLSEGRSALDVFFEEIRQLIICRSQCKQIRIYQMSMFFFKK